MFTSRERLLWVRDSIAKLRNEIDGCVGRLATEISVIDSLLEDMEKNERQE